ncbi:hypothetical protein BZA77DRAFT_171275 [Pyronema omphalodes]|nr:hypothetical protein BZA77DRAFT_171275 [Pyronema omphalodes]
MYSTVVASHAASGFKLRASLLQASQASQASASPSLTFSPSSSSNRAAERSVAGARLSTFWDRSKLEGLFWKEGGLEDIVGLGGLESYSRGGLEYRTGVLEFWKKERVLLFLLFSFCSCSLLSLLCAFRVPFLSQNLFVYSQYSYNYGIHYCGRELEDDISHLKYSTIHISLLALVAFLCRFMGRDTDKLCTTYLPTYIL